MTVTILPETRAANGEHDLYGFNLTQPLIGGAYAHRQAQLPAHPEFEPPLRDGLGLVAPATDAPYL